MTVSTGTGGPRAAARLEADVWLRRGDFELRAALAAEPGEVIAVLGPNGAGKSTLLGMLAGLLVPDSGSIRLGGRLLTGPGVLITPERRKVGLMGQDPLLFPHLSALENIAFGPRARGDARADARAAARAWLERLDLAEFADRRPLQLSGGQQQRIALARALAVEPDLLLLDEPLAALDVQTAPEVRQALRTHLRETGTTTVVITHDVLDAATLADRALVLADGRIVDDGPVAQILAAPRSEFTAALAGLNLLDGRIGVPAQAGQAVTMTDEATAGERGAEISGLAAEPLPAGEVSAVFAPNAVAVYLGEPGVGSPRNAWPATVASLERGPSTVRVRATLGETSWMISADVTPAAVAELDLTPGARVHLAVKATEVRVHPHR